MFTPETLDVVMVSFEGPDQYSQAGGLGVRARELCRAFAALGFRTTLVFVGDPDKPGMEMDQGVQLVRWCQQISARYRNGVYEGELAKIRDLTATLPDKLIDDDHPAGGRGRPHRRRALRGVAHRLVLQIAERSPARSSACASTPSCSGTPTTPSDFEAIDWPVLDFVATITTVSKYMKHLMWPYGVNPVVIPNGIPESALAPVDMSAAKAIRAAAGTPCLAFKIGRFSPDKRWTQAVAAIAELRSEGLPARMLMRGGMEPYGATVLAFAAECGLAVTDWHEPVEDAGGIVRALTETDGAPIVHLRRFLPDQVITEINVARDRGARQLRARAVRPGRARGDGGRRDRHGRRDRRGVRAPVRQRDRGRDRRSRGDRERAARSRRAAGARRAAARRGSARRRRLRLAARHRRACSSASASCACTSEWCCRSTDQPPRT